MTAMIAIAANPAEGQKPYFLIASDSMKVSKQLDEQGQLSTVLVENDCQKIFKINENIVIGIAGKMDDWFIDELIDRLEKSELNFNDFCQFTLDKTENYIKNQTTFEFARCNIVIGHVNGISSSVAQFLISKENPQVVKLEIFSPQKGNAIPVNIGNTEGMSDLFDNFKMRVKNAVNINSLVVKKAAKEYVESVADRKPESCDKNVVIVKI